MRRLTFLFLLSLPWLMLWTACQSPKAEPAQPPNVLFLFADDLTYAAVHALGNQDVHTPNLDRLAAMGTTFSHAYNMGAWGGAVCVASRAMIISGRSVWRVNQFRQHWQQGDSLEKTWPRLMQGAGYATYMTGKWHVDAPAEAVFQQATHVRPGMPGDGWRGAKVGQKLQALPPSEEPASVMPIGYARPQGPDDQSWQPYDTSFGGYWEGGTHWSEVVKNDALSFIEQAHASDKPFFMYLAFNAPHDPRQAPKSFVDRYPLEAIDLPPNWQEDYPYRNDIGNGWGLRDEALGPIPRTEYAGRVHLQEYYAIITHMDEQIGLILDALEASGQLDNTYLFFTADHGLAIGSHGLLGKQNMYDHSLRVPLFMAGPGIPAGATVSADVYLQDIMPTALELAGIPQPSYVEFHSLMDLAQGRQTESAYEAIYGCYTRLQRAIRKDGYKLILYPNAQKARLYHLDEDPYETRDLAREPEQQETLKAMFEDLMQLQEEMGDELDLRPLYEQLITPN